MAKELEAEDIELKDYIYTPKEITVNGNSVIDYTDVENDNVFLCNKKDILDKPRPSWIPEFDAKGLALDNFLPICVKDFSDGNYFVQSKVYTEERDANGKPVYKNLIYKMSPDVLAATVDYYLKRARAELKRDGRTEKVSLPRGMNSMPTSRYNEISKLCLLCKTPSLKYKDTDKSITDKAFELKGKSPGKLYHIQNNVVFLEQWQPLLENIKGKRLDMNYQKQDYIDSYSKAVETAYGDSNTFNNLYKDFGVKIKKQNGSNFSKTELDKLSETIEKVYNHYGNLSNLASEYKLKISYADNCMQFARKSIGLFTSFQNAIGISFFNEEKQLTVAGDKHLPDITLAHEIAHWLDNQKGKETHNFFASDKYGTLENQIAEKFKEEIKLREKSNKSAAKIGKADEIHLGEYWFRTCECFARAMEQYYALQHGIDLSEEISYARKDNFEADFVPLIKQLMEENRKHFGLENNSIKGPTLSKENSSDVEFYNESFEYYKNSISPADYPNFNFMLEDIKREREYFSKSNEIQGSKKRLLELQAKEDFINSVSKEYKKIYEESQNITNSQQVTQEELEEEKLLIQKKVQQMKNFEKIGISENIQKEKENKPMAKEQKCIAKWLDKDGRVVDFERFAIKDIKKINRQCIELDAYSLIVSKDKLINFDFFKIFETLPDGSDEKLKITSPANLYLQSVANCYKKEHGHLPIEDEYDSARWHEIMNKRAERLGQSIIEPGLSKADDNFSFFVKDTAEFEQFAAFEPITNLTAKEAVSKFEELRNKGLNAGIGINIPNDIVFDDPEGNGITILVTDEKKLANFNIFGENFISDLNIKSEKDRSFLKNRIAAYEALYNELVEQSIPAIEPEFVYNKKFSMELSNIENEPVSEQRINSNVSIEIKPVTLEEILDVMDMRPDYKENGSFMIYDIQRQEYISGWVEMDEEDGAAIFHDAQEAFERLDIYINDYYIHDMQEQLEAVGIELTGNETLSELCKLYKTELGKGNDKLSIGELNLAMGIVEPDTVIYEQRPSVEKKLESTLQPGQNVSLSLKQLYEELAEKNGTYFFNEKSRVALSDGKAIEFDDGQVDSDYAHYDELTHYDLYSKEGELLCCDGETVSFEGEAQSGNLIFKNNDIGFSLSKEEFEIASKTVSLEQRKEEANEIRPEFFLYGDTSDEKISELKEHLSKNGYDVKWQDKSETNSFARFTCDIDDKAYIQTILEDRGIDYEYELGLLATGYDAAWLNEDEVLDAEVVTREEFKRINEFREKEFKDLKLPYIKIDFTESSNSDHKYAGMQSGTVLGLKEGEELLTELNNRFNTFLKADVTVYFPDAEDNEPGSYNLRYDFTDDVRHLDDGKEIPFEREGLSDYIRMTCSYPEVLEKYEQQWQKVNAPNITEEQKKIVADIIAPNYEKLKNRYNEQLENLNTILGVSKKLNSGWIVNSSESKASEESIEKELDAISVSFERYAGRCINSIADYLNENKDLSFKNEFINYAEHQISNMLQDVKYGESRNAKYGEHGYDFDFTLWRNSLEKVMDASEYKSFFTERLQIEEKRYKEIRNAAKDMGMTKDETFVLSNEEWRACDALAEKAKMDWWFEEYGSDGDIHKDVSKEDLNDLSTAFDGYMTIDEKYRKPIMEIFKRANIEFNDITLLTTQEISSRAENLYGFYFEYNDDEKCSDIYSSKDGDFVGSYSDGGFGYADGMGIDVPKIPDEVFQDVIALSRQFYIESEKENEKLRSLSEAKTNEEVLEIQTGATEIKAESKEHEEEVTEDTFLEPKGSAESLSDLPVEELREGLKYALNEVAQPLPEIDFTRENYNKLFPRDRLNTPIETVKIGAHQFEKLEAKDRKNLLQAVHDVLSNPDVIINEEKESIFGDMENSHVYAKSYVINEKTKAVQSVVVNIEDEYISISTHKRDISNVVNKIKKPDQILFAAAEVRLLAEQHTKEKLSQSVVSPNRENEYIIPPQTNIPQPQEKSSDEISESFTIKGEKYSFSDAEALLKEDIAAIFEELDSSEIEQNLTLNGVKIYGNPEKDGKIKILVEFDSKNPENKWREDSLFNAIADENITFNGIEVDVNPITPEKSGTIEEYLSRLERLGAVSEAEAIEKQAELIASREEIKEDNQIDDVLENVNKTLDSVLDKKEKILPFSIIDNTEKGRVNIKFDTVENNSEFQNILKELKSNGWKFAPSTKQWYPVGKAVAGSADFANRLQEKYSIPLNPDMKTAMDIGSKKSAYDGIRFFDRNYNESKEFADYFNSHLSELGEKVEGISEKDASVILKAIGYENKGILENRNNRLGLDKKDNLVILEKDKSDVKTVTTDLKGLMEIAKEHSVQNVEEAKKGYEKYKTENNLSDKGLQDIFASMYEECISQSESIKNKMGLIYDKYAEKKVSMEQSSYSISELALGEKLGKDTVTDIYKISEGIHQVTLSRQENGVGSAQNYFVIDNSIVRQLDSELKGLVTSYDSKSVIENKIYEPYILRDLISKNLMPPRDDEFVHKLDEYIAVHPLKYEKLKPVDYLNFERKLKEIAEVDKKLNKTPFELGQQLVALVDEIDRPKLMVWLKQQGCDSEENMKKVFATWLKEEPEQKKDVNRKKENGYPPRGEN